MLFYNSSLNTTLLPFIVGVICATALGVTWSIITPYHTQSLGTHDTESTASSTVHVHADFLMYLDHQRIRFTADQYQTTEKRELHPNLHFHNGKDTVVHRHAKDATLVDFLASLGYVMREGCLISDTNRQYCNSAPEAELIVYVNGEPITSIEDYVFADGDQILVYYGNPNDPRVHTYLNEITDEACIHSGTCPSRGTAPPEACGLTCNI